MLKKRIKLDSLIRNLLNDLSVKKNDKILFHSIYSWYIFQFNQKKSEQKDIMHKLLKNLINHVGKKGTVLIPTYNYDFPKNKKFDRKKSFFLKSVFLGNT